LNKVGDVTDYENRFHWDGGTVDESFEDPQNNSISQHPIVLVQYPLKDSHMMTLKEDTKFYSATSDYQYLKQAQTGRNSPMP
jgi:hypothetical protein